MVRTTRESEASAAAVAIEEDEARQMEQAEFFVTTIMDARAVQDAIEQDERLPGDGACGSAPVDLSSSAAVEVEVDAADDTASDAAEPASPVCPSTSDASASPVTAAAAAHLALPPSLSLPLIEDDEARAAVQWDLISPWSEAAEDDDEADDDLASPSAQETFFTCSIREVDDDAVSVASSTASSHVTEPESEARMEERLRALVAAEQAKALEVKLSRQAGALDKRSAAAEDEDDEIITRDMDIDEDDEEFEVFNVSMLVKENADGEELFEEKLDSVGTEEDENEDCTDGTRTSVATTMDDSCEESPRASSSSASASRWGRIKAHTYTGNASVSVQSAYAKIRSRTLSTASSFRHSSSQSCTSEMGDDGDFSSDDEGYSKDRVSRMDGSRTPSRRTLVSRLSSVGNLKVPTKMGGFLRFRSSSATTTTSEDSNYVTSPTHSAVRCEAQSAPLFSSYEEPFASPVAPSLQQHPSQQGNNNHQIAALKLKASACAVKAAGYLNAASAEAARKLKSKTFRNAASAAGGKPGASETEEEGEPVSLAASLSLVDERSAWS